MYRSTCAAFFLSTHVCTCTEAQLVQVCLHKMYPRVFFEQNVLRGLAKLNAIEITGIAFALGPKRTWIFKAQIFII